MKLIISFSGRKGGNSDGIAEYIAAEKDKIVYFRELNAHNCSNCDYECFNGECKYRDDGVYSLFESMASYDKVIFIVPMYCSNPSGLYFTFNERSQDFFMQNEEKYGDMVNKLRIIGVYGSKESYPHFIPCLVSWFNDGSLSDKIIEIERHKYNLKLKDNLLEVAKIRKILDELK